VARQTAHWPVLKATLEIEATSRFSRLAGLPRNITTTVLRQYTCAPRLYVMCDADDSYLGPDADEENASQPALLRKWLDTLCVPIQRSDSWDVVDLPLQNFAVLTPRVKVLPAADGRAAVFCNSCDDDYASKNFCRTFLFAERDTHWSELPPLGPAGRAMAATAVNQSLYVLGGDCSAGRTTPAVRCLRNEATEWTEVGEMLRSRIYHTVLATTRVDNTLHILSGTDGNGNRPVIQNERFDITQGGLCYESPGFSPAVLQTSGCVVDNSTLFVCGGRICESNRFVGFVWMRDTREASWTKLPESSSMLNARGSHACFLLNEDVCAFGGRSTDDDGWQSHYDGELYDLRAARWRDAPHLYMPGAPNSCDISVALLT
jgi:hypothetical protein